MISFMRIYYNSAVIRIIKHSSHCQLLSKTVNYMQRRPMLKMRLRCIFKLSACLSNVCTQVALRHPNVLTSPIDSTLNVHIINNPRPIAD